MGTNCSYNCCAKDDINYIKKAQEVELDNVINHNNLNPTESNILPTTNRRENIQEFNVQENELNAMKNAYDTKKNYPPNQTESSKNNRLGEEEIDMEYMKEKEQTIVKLQANIRGHMGRKHASGLKTSKNQDEKKTHKTNTNQNIHVEEIKTNPNKKESMKEKPHITEEHNPNNFRGMSQLNNNGIGKNNLGVSSKISGVPENSEASRLILTTIGILDRKQLIPITFENQAIYSGFWLNTMRDGHGTQKWIDGSYYDGEWRNDRANGYGKLVHADGDIYEGNWMDDKACGYGTYIHKNAAKYVGEWKDDKQNGKGVETWPDGAKYEGNYSEGKKHGTGNLFFSDGSVYKGQFTRNEIEGYGVYIWPDGKKYEGDWLRNKMHGKGKLLWADGRKYDGEFKEDKKHGQGTFEWGDGRKYIGGWINGKQNGVSIYYTSTGEKKKGEWSEGKRLQWIEEKA